MPILRTVSAWHLHCANSEKLFDTSWIAVLVRCLGGQGTQSQRRKLVLGTPTLELSVRPKQGETFAPWPTMGNPRIFCLVYDLAQNKNDALKSR